MMQEESNAARLLNSPQTEILRLWLLEQWKVELIRSVRFVKEVVLNIDVHTLTHKHIKDVPILQGK